MSFTLCKRRLNFISDSFFFENRPKARCGNISLETMSIKISTRQITCYRNKGDNYKMIRPSLCLCLSIRQSLFLCVRINKFKTSSRIWIKFWIKFCRSTGYRTKTKWLDLSPALVILSIFIYQKAWNGRICGIQYTIHYRITQSRINNADTGVRPSRTKNDLSMLSLLKLRDKN